MSFKSGKPNVLFVCVKNGGKSQMAAGLMAKIAGGAVDVHSGGTKPGKAINELSAESLAEMGVDIRSEVPKPVTEAAQRAADVVVLLGDEVDLDEVDGTRYERWITDEPSRRGIDGIERMRLVRDDINSRVRQLHQELLH